MTSFCLIRVGRGNRSNTCVAAGILHHHHRKICSSSIKTLAPTSILSVSSPHSHTVKIPKLPFSSSYDPYSNLQFLQHQCHPSQAPAPDISPSVPANMVFIRRRSEYLSAVKQVEDGRLPAVFFFTPYMCRYTMKELTPTIRLLREKYPHVTIYKTILNEYGTLELCTVLNIYWSAFHFYVNGRMVEEISGEDPYLHIPHTIYKIVTDAFRKNLVDTFEELYRYVIPVKTTKPRSSLEILRRTQQFVEKDENRKGVPISSSGKAEQEDNGTLVERSDVPSLHQIMEVVSSIRRFGSVWWFAKGLFKANPEKSVIFSTLGRVEKLVWLWGQAAEE